MRIQKLKLCQELHEYQYQVFHIISLKEETVGKRRFSVIKTTQPIIDLVAEWCNRCGVEIWAYCLMPNHVHLITVPDKEDSLAKAIGEAHRRYTRYINFREGWRGHLWQGCFASYPMDDIYLIVAVRYVELNPV